MDRDAFHKLGSDPSLCDALLWIDKKKLINRRDVWRLGVSDAELAELERLGWVERHDAPIGDFDKFHQTAKGMKMARELKRLTTS